MSSKRSAEKLHTSTGVCWYSDIKVIVLSQKGNRVPLILAIVVAHISGRLLVPVDYLLVSKQNTS
ncbi:Uncharacterized protein APZ42_022351 [Daphnia magna]|uniref:Uncharacterized protein n=1 Tax=Daphnia magna TaxID=35525 RepID=A0A164VF17_9CRUS|nr:Uncharacterized protein APZ42_022351 [Daphnia magna]